MIWEITAKYHEYFITYVNPMSYFTAGKLHLQFVIAFNLQQWYKLDRYCCCAMIMCNKVNELSVWSWTQNVWLCFHIRFIDLSLLSANAIIAEHHHPHVCTLSLSQLFKVMEEAWLMLFCVNSCLVLVWCPLAAVGCCRVRGSGACLRQRMFAH